MGWPLPGAREVLAATPRPVLNLLHLATFTSLPLTLVCDALANERFVPAAVIGDLLTVPVMVCGAIHLLPADSAIRSRLLPVPLVPWTDWLIAFTRQEGGEREHAIALIPSA